MYSGWSGRRLQRKSKIGSVCFESFEHATAQMVTKEACAFQDETALDACNKSTAIFQLIPNDGMSASGMHRLEQSAGGNPYGLGYHLVEHVNRRAP